MDREKYQTMQAQLMTLACFAINGFSDEDLKEFVEQGQHSLVIAPIFNPTLFMVGKDKLQAVMGIAQAVQQLRAAALKSHDLIERGERTAEVYRAMGVNVDGL